MLTLDSALDTSNIDAQKNSTAETSRKNIKISRSSQNSLKTIILFFKTLNGFCNKH